MTMERSQREANPSRSPAQGTDPNSTPGASLVLVTHPEEGAAEFAAAVVEARLAGCVNLLGTSSVYRWEGVLERAREVLLMIKTADERLEELERFVRTEHPYDTPEFVVFAPRAVEANYLAWLLEACLGAGPGQLKETEETGGKGER